MFAMGPAFFKQATVSAAVTALAQWNLDETSGTAAADSSGHGYNGTYGGSGYVLGSMSLLPSGAGKSFYNPGTARVALPSTLAPARSAPFTILSYVNIADFSNSPQIYSEYNGGIGFSISPAGKMNLANPGVALLAADTTTLALNTTYLLGVSYTPTGNVIEFCVNGVLSSSASGTAAPTAGVSPAFLGAYNTSNNVLKGYQQRVRVFNAKLSPADQAALYAAD